MALLRDMYFQKTDLGSIDSELSEEAKALLRVFDGRKPFFEVQQAVSLAPAVFKRCFLELFQKKLIEEVREPVQAPAESEACIDAAALDQLRAAAVKVAGPVGELLVSDALDRLKLDPSQVPASRLHELIEAIADDIPGEKQQKQFLEGLPPQLSGR